MRMAGNIRARAEKLKKEITAVHYAYQNPRTGLLPRVIILIALGYALSPVDLIPDFIPVIGYLDDLLIIPALISVALRMIPEEVMAEARKKAEQEPLTLGKNWFVGSLFIIAWLIVLAIIVRAVIEVFQKCILN